MLKIYTLSLIFEQKKILTSFVLILCHFNLGCIVFVSLPFGRARHLLSQHMFGL